MQAVRRGIDPHAPALDGVEPDQKRFDRIFEGVEAFVVVRQVEGEFQIAEDFINRRSDHRNGRFDGRSFLTEGEVGGDGTQSDTRQNQ